MALACALSLAFLPGQAMAKPEILIPQPAKTFRAAASMPAFRDLAKNPSSKGRNTLLTRDTVSTRTVQWREKLRRRAQGSSYADLTLPDLIDLALAHNLALQNSERSVRRAKSVYREAKAEFIPFAEVASRALYTESKANASPALSQVKSFTYGGGPKLTQNLPTGGQFVVSSSLDKRRFISEIPGASDDTNSDYQGKMAIDFVQPLLRGGGFNVNLSNVRLGRLSEMSAELQDFVARNDVVLDVIQRFYLIAITASDIEVNLASLDVDDKSIRDAQTLYEKGWAIPNEVSLARVQYLNDELKFIQLEQKLQDQIQALLGVLGLPLDTAISVRDLTGSALDARQAGIPDADTAVHEALADRAELLLAEIALQRSRILADNARNDTLPNLDLTASYGDTEVNSHSRDALDLDEHRERSVGLALTIPLPNIPRKEARKRAELDVETAKTDREIRERGIRLDVESLQRQMKRTEESIEVLKRTLEQAKFSFEQESQLYLYAQVTSNDVRLAQEKYFQAQTNYNSAVLNCQILIAQIYRALGRPFVLAGGDSPLADCCRVGLGPPDAVDNPTNGGPGPTLRRLDIEAQLASVAGGLNPKGVPLESPGLRPAFWTQPW